MLSKSAIVGTYPEPWLSRRQRGNGCLPAGGLYFILQISNLKLEHQDKGWKVHLWRLSCWLTKQTPVSNSSVVRHDNRNHNRKPVAGSLKIEYLALLWHMKLVFTYHNFITCMTHTLPCTVATVHFFHGTFVVFWRSNTGRSNVEHYRSTIVIPSRSKPTRRDVLSSLLFRCYCTRPVQETSWPLIRK